MSIADRLPTSAPTRLAHREEWLSMLVCALGTALALGVLWGTPDYQPVSGLGWTVPGWLGLFYLLTQIICLLVSAAQIRVLGLVDSVVAILPVIAGLVTGIEWLIPTAQIPDSKGISVAARP